MGYVKPESTARNAHPSLAEEEAPHRLRGAVQPFTCSVLPSRGPEPIGAVRRVEPHIG